MKLAEGCLPSSLTPLIDSAVARHLWICDAVLVQFKLQKLEGALERGMMRRNEFEDLCQTIRNEIDVLNDSPERGEEMINDLRYRVELIRQKAFVSYN